MILKKQIKDLKRGDFFLVVKYKKTGGDCLSTRVYVRDEYDRTEKKYYAHEYYDVCSFRAFKPTQEVIVDFEF